ISKNKKHSYGAHENNPWSIYWMHFDGVLAESLFERYQSKKKNIITASFESGLIDTFNKIFEICGSSYIDSQMEYASLLGINFLSFFIYNGLNNDRHVHSDYENLVDAIIDFMTKYLDKPYRSEDIAEHFNYSSSYIFSLFKKKTGY